MTAPRHLGIMGGSNGGLLMGNMLTRRPDLCHAVVCQVPLLDMQRYHTLLAGASWVAEYGNSDLPEDWEFIRTFSPYHNIDRAKTCPRTLFTTSTRDDRVHPGHARKMVALMKMQGHDVLYYENIEGGHGGDQAYYAPGPDVIQLPLPEAFWDAESYAATKGHELVHWTKHPTRLTRDCGGKRCGDVGYAREELVAELGAAFLCADLGITPEPRADHAAYLASWLRVLPTDTRAIFTAAAHAQRAVDYLHSRQEWDA